MLSEMADQDGDSSGGSESASTAPRRPPAPDGEPMTDYGSEPQTATSRSTSPVTLVQVWNVAAEPGT
jgi:hypothetical protein